MDRACFRRNCKLVSGRAEVVSAGAEDLVLGVVCVGWLREGRGKCLEFAAKWFTFPRKTNGNSGKANIPQGKCLGFAVKRFTFPGRTGKNGENFQSINNKSLLVPHNKKPPCFPHSHNRR